MSNVLLTAFEPYDRWPTNASWLALVELTRELPREPTITTRLYPVDFAEVKQRLVKDLAGNYDFAIHLGQAPGSSRVQLEAIGINVGGSSHQSPDQYLPLADDGPMAYRSPLAWPIGRSSSARRGFPLKSPITPARISATPRCIGRTISRSD